MWSRFDRIGRRAPPRWAIPRLFAPLTRPGSAAGYTARVLRRLLTLFPLLFVLAAPAVLLAQDDDDSAAPAPEPMLVAPPAPPPGPAELWAEALQVTLPAWSARTESALARAEAAKAYFSGDESIEVAFQTLGRGPHHSLPWLNAQLTAIDARETDRLRERSVAPPAFDDSRRTARWTSARAAALDSEDLADAQERRLLLALRGVATDHPALAGADYLTARRALQDRLPPLESRWADAVEGAGRDRLAADIAAVHDEIARLDAHARAARRWASVPGAEPPSPDGDLALLGTASGPLAAERLDRLRPALTAEARHRVDVALVAWLQDERLPAARAALAAAQEMEASAATSPLPSRWALNAHVIMAITELGAATRQLAAIGGDDPVSVLRRRELEVRRAAAQHRLAAHQVHFGRSGHVVAKTRPSVEAEAAAARAEAAREEADRAAEEAKDARSRRVAGVLEEVATVEAEAQGTWDAIKKREAALADEVAAWQASLGELDAEVVAIADLPPGLGGERGTRSAAVWTRLHDQLTILRKGAIEAGAGWSRAQEDRVEIRRSLAESEVSLGEARKFVRSLPVGDSRANLETALDQWEAALGDRRNAANHGVEIAETHRASVLALLQDEKRLRARVRDDVPASALARDQEVLFEDLQLELSLVVPNLTSLARRRLESLASLPRLVQRLDRLWALVVGSFWLLLAAVVWLWGRARVVSLVPSAVGRWESRRAQLFTRSFDSLNEPLARVVQAAVDLVAVSLLLPPVRDRLPELALILVLFRLVALYRLLDGLFRLAVAPLEENRPALLALRRDAWTLTVRATRLLLAWLILGNFVQYICRDLLGADALGQVLGTAFSGAFLLLSLFLLHQAEPHLRAAVQRAPESAIRAWLTTPPSNPLVSRAPRGLVALLLLVGLRVWQLLQGNVEETSALGAILNVVNRKWLATRPGSSGAGLTPIPPNLARRLDNDAARTEIATLYPELDAEFDAAWTGWKEENARGLVLLVGDRGQGKQVWVKRTLDRLETEDGPPIHRARLSLRLVKPGHLFGYLAREWGLGAISTADEFERALKKQPTSCFLIEEIEFAFLRRVGGFAALRAFFRVITATSSDHFWLLTVHAPAWRLLERIGTVANPNSFRSVLQIPRLGGMALGQYLGLRTTSAGFRPDFSALSSSTPAGQPVAETERTAEAYFRLLAEASGGNPGIALPLWTASLCPTDDVMLTTGEFRSLDDAEPVQPAEFPRLRVHLPDVIANPSLPPLSDSALLTLAAVRVHGFLNVQEIMEANNMDQDLVRTTAQVLESLGLLESIDGRYRIAMLHLPAVTRLLRRRHFIYGKDGP